MEVSKVQPADFAANRAGTAGSSEQGAQTAADIVPLADRVDIRPLDIAAALQILLAEVRAALNLPAGSAIVQSPPQAARELVEMFLQALPEDASDAPAWIATLGRLETALQSSIELAIGAVAAWREVSQVVVEATKETRTLLFSLLSDEPQNPLWLQPEWMRLATRMQRFRRRRREAHRRLTDPDCPPASFEENEELR